MAIIIQLFDKYSLVFDNLMATLLGSDSSDPEKENVFKKIRNRIEEKFGSVIQKVIERRDAPPTARAMGTGTYKRNH